jgi:putative PIN family toxin of toxin-antitoxin system
MRLVLDTNVWLDWLVFDEPSLAPLRKAHAAGRVEIVMDAACEAELARVLAYDLGKHTIGAEAQAKCIERCRSLAKRVEVNAAEAAAAETPAAATAIPAAGAAGAQALPRCSDPHDQKFLELALAAKADALVTKDQALLDLARRKLPFRIAAPQALGAL